MAEDFVRNTNLPSRELSQIWGHDVDGRAGLQSKADILAGTASASQVAGVAAIARSVFTAETIVWLQHCAALGIAPPRYAIARAVDDFIADLIDCGAWQQLSHVGARFLPQAAAALVGLKNPAETVWTADPGLAHVSGIGFVGDGARRIVSSRPLSSFSSFAEASCSVGVLASAASAGDAGFALSTTAGEGDGVTIAIQTETGEQTVRLCTSTSETYDPSPAPLGGAVLVSGVRDGAMSMRTYRDGAQVGANAAVTSVAPPESRLSLLGSGAARSTAILHGDFVGGSLTADQMSGLTAAFASLRATIGAF